MKRSWTIGLLMGFSVAGGARAADLTLDLATASGTGRIAVAVYDDADAFARSRGPMRTVMVARTGTVTRAVIGDLKPGRYAVAAFHDTDGNGRLTLWPIGLPREAYGFSNEARGRFGAPRWGQASFVVPADGTTQTITLK